MAYKRISIDTSKHVFTIHAKASGLHDVSEDGFDDMFA